MRKILINIGERSKQAFAQPINTNKKNKVLSDYTKKFILKFFSINLWNADFMT